MDHLRERVLGAVMMVVFSVVATSALVLAGVEDLFAAVILGTPAMTPAFIYRGYAEVEFFEYGRLRAEKSTAVRWTEMGAISLLAGSFAVPLALATYRYIPSLGRSVRFGLGFVLAAGILLLIGPLCAVLHNVEYLEVEIENGSLLARLGFGETE